MKKAVIFIVSIIILNCVSKEKNNIMNIEERLSYITKNIKKFDYEPSYRLKVKTNLNYEIRINDFPVAKKFNSNNGTLWFPINIAIIESGSQKIQIKLYPSMINDTESNLTLENYSMFELSIEKVLFSNEGTVDNEQEIFTYTKPEKDFKGEIDYDKLRASLITEKN